MAEQIIITIVDDEQDMRESISQWLSLSGYKTETYASADLALKDIGPDYPGIIISDIKMPGTDGISFLKKLQKIDNALPVPERMAELAKRAVQTRYLTLENRSLRRELSDGSVLLRKLMGTSTVMGRLREDILDFLSHTPFMHVALGKEKNS